MFCPNCGKDIGGEGKKFCPECGAEVKMSQENTIEHGSTITPVKKKTALPIILACALVALIVVVVFVTSTREPYADIHKQLRHGYWLSFDSSGNKVEWYFEKDGSFSKIYDDPHLRLEEPWFYEIIEGPILQLYTERAKEEEREIKYSMEFDRNGNITLLQQGAEEYEVLFNIESDEPFNEESVSNEKLVGIWRLDGEEIIVAFAQEYYIEVDYDNDGAKDDWYDYYIVNNDTLIVSVLDGSVRIKVEYEFMNDGELVLRDGDRESYFVRDMF